MTAEELISKLAGLTGDEKEAASAALTRILQGKMKTGSGKGLPLPPEIDLPVDPELDEPEDEFAPFGEAENDVDAPEIDDPDNLLKDKKGDSKKSSEEDDRTVLKKDNDIDNESDSEYEDDGGDSGESVLDNKDEKDEKKANEIRSRRSTINRVLKAAYKALDKATDELAKEAVEKAIDTINKLADLSDEELVEIAKNELDSIVNSALEAINNVTPISYTRDLESRVKEINADNKDTLSRNELSAEDRNNYEVDPAYQKKKAADAEKDKYVMGSVASLEKFKFDFEKAIADQVEQYEEVEYEMNMEDERHMENDIYQPRIRIDDEFTGEIPSIDVYFDQSGSWGDDEVRKGMDAISVINHFEKEGKIKLNIFYFSAILTQDQRAARSQGARECWDLIVDNIMAEPKTKNVVIVTDRDIAYNYGSTGQHGCIYGPHATVDGHVWWIWKYAYDRVSQAVHALNGKAGTTEYALY